MGTIDLKLNASVLQRFTERGIKLHGLSQTGQLTADSSFEPPTSVQATVTPGSSIAVGAFCSLSGGTIGNVRFGRYCSLAHGTVMGAHEHPTDWLTSSRTAYWPQVHGWDRVMRRPEHDGEPVPRPSFTASCPITEVGNDVWIGQGAFIKSGVRLGHGAIVGARATVVRDVPPYAIVVGTPAKVLRLRFPEPVVERLLRVAWWRYSIYDLAGVPFDRIEAALDEIERRIADGLVRPYDPIALTAADLADPERVLNPGLAA